jgi:demethylmenaquinone methyltransferase / 2-methoxy-6-polyprenyl-1,4-benzoquinol methylase
VTSASPEQPGGESRRGNSVPEPSVTSLFDSIAPVYDRMNTMMTAGLDGRWRKAAVRASRLRPGNAALDVACGTGKLTGELAVVVGERGRVVGVDISEPMLEEARKSLAEMPWVELRQGNALALPVEDGAFDVATIAFGLRNLSDFEAGFREMARTVRPGGRVVCLELSVPRSRNAGRLYTTIFRLSAPAMGTLFRRRSAYAYLPHSLEGFPGAEEMAAVMRRAGLTDVRFKRLGLGTVALHVGVVGPR